MLLSWCPVVYAACLVPRFVHATYVERYLKHDYGDIMSHPRVSDLAFWVGVRTLGLNPWRQAHGHLEGCLVFRTREFFFCRIVTIYNIDYATTAVCSPCPQRPAIVDHFAIVGLPDFPRFSRSFTRNAPCFLFIIVTVYNDVYTTMSTRNNPMSRFCRPTGL